MKFLAELSRRNVFRMAGLYLVGAWLVVQVAATLLPVFEAPAWVMKALVATLSVGFFAALVFAWIFELTPDGLKRDAEVPASETVAPQTGKRMDRMIIVALSLALAYFAFDKFVLHPKRDMVRGATPSGEAEQHTTQGERVVPADGPSIAVLPFDDMSQAGDQEYFSDGLSEELLNQLAQLQQLRVIARTSSFSFKGRDVTIPEIAHTLNVGHVLEGSVRKSGNTLRITAKLIRASDSSQLWSGTFDRDLTDVFAVQDEISREVVAALKLQLLPDKQPDNTQRTRNPQAYEQFLIGRDVSRASGREAIEASLAALGRAIALDPEYANAYAELSLSQTGMADFTESPAEREAMIDTAMATANKAILVAPDLPDGYIARGNVRFRMRWDWQAAQDDFAHALKIDPNRSETLLRYAQVLFSHDKREEAFVLLHRAISADPLSELCWLALGRFQQADGDLAGAKVSLTRALQIRPQQNWANLLLGNQLLEEGLVEDAIGFYHRAPEPWRSTGLAMAEFTRGNDEASRLLVDNMEANYGIGFAFQIAQVHAWRGDKDLAFEWLDRAYAIHDAGMARLPYDPAVDPLRDDPRFAALLKRMGFPQ